MANTYNDKLAEYFGKRKTLFQSQQLPMGGPVLGPLVGLMSLLSRKGKASDPITQNFVVPSNNNASIPPKWVDGSWTPQTFGQLGQEEMRRAWAQKTELEESNENYSLQEPGVKLTEGHLRGAKIPNSLIQDVKKAGDKYGVDPLDILAVAGKESTFGYGPFGSTRVQDGQIRSRDLFTFNDFTVKPPKTFEEFAFDKGKKVEHEKGFHGYRFTVPDSEIENIYNDHDLKKEYIKYLSKFKDDPEQVSIVDLIAKRIAERGVGSINPGDTAYPQRVQQYKQLLMNNRTPIKFQQGGYAGDPLNFVFPSRGLVPDYAQDGLSGYFEDPLMLPHAKGGGFFGGIWKGIKGVGKVIGKGFGAFADQGLSALGMPNVIKNSGYDQMAPDWLKKVNSGIGSVATGVLGAAIPGAGMALQGLQGLAGLFGGGNQGGVGGYGFPGMNFGGMGVNFNDGDYGSTSMLAGLNPFANIGSFGNMGGQQYLGGNQQQFGTALGQLIGNFQGQGFGGVNPQGGSNQHPLYGDLTSNLMGTAAFEGVFGKSPGFGGTPGFAGIQPRYYQEGGEVEQGPAMIPIQTEKGEVFIHLDGSITPVNAKTTHKRMDEDEVTDVVPEGTYVTSNDKKIRMTAKEAEDIVMGVKALPYEEFKKGVLPEETLFSEIFGNSKKLTPAEMTQKILRKFPTMDRSTTWDKNDIFTEITNKENMNNRLPWLEQVILFNESRRGKQPAREFKQGGPVKMDGVRHLPKGGSVRKFGPGGDILSVLGTAAPFLLDLFGANKGSNIDPIARNMILGSSPLYAAGVNQNINAQNQQLGTSIQDFTGLGQNLNTLAAAQAGTQIGGRSLLKTDFQRFDPLLQDARLANFQTRTPNAVIDALSTPRYDLNALAGTLGPRAFSNFASQLVNSENETRNNAILNQFNADRGMGLNILGQRNALDTFGQQFNIGQAEKQQAARNAQTAGIFGDVSSYFGRLGDIQSQILPITTQLALQKAGLAGQKEMNIAQNLMNTGSVYAQLGEQQPQQTGGTGTGNYEFLKNLIGTQVNQIGQNRVNTNRADFMNPNLNPFISQPVLQPLPQIRSPYTRLDPFGRPIIQ